jgi:branched-chain amino acid transport system permease protein
LIVLFIFIILAPLIFGNFYFFDTINLIGIYVLAVIGLNLILGITGLISMGHAAFFGLGAYFSAYISIHYEINSFLAVIISCLLVAFIVFVLSFPLLRLSGYFLALGTLGIGVIVHTLLNGGGSLTGGPNGMTGIPGFSIGSFTFSSATDLFYLIWLTVLVVYIIAKNMMNSREGRALKAIHSDEEAASSFGINIFISKMKIFIVGSTMSALAGAYYAHYMAFISPEISSLNSSIDLITMGFLGGLGSYLGPVFGSAVFQAIPQITANAQEYQTLIEGFILLLIIIFFRGGIQSVINKAISILKQKKSIPAVKEVPSNKQSQILNKEGM